MVYRESSAKWAVLLILAILLVGIPAGASSYITALNRDSEELQANIQKLQLENSSLRQAMQEASANISASNTALVNEQHRYQELERKYSTTLGQIAILSATLQLKVQKVEQVVTSNTESSLVERTSDPTQPLPIILLASLVLVTIGGGLTRIKITGKHDTQLANVQLLEQENTRLHANIIIKSEQITRMREYYHNALRVEHALVKQLRAPIDPDYNE